MATKPWYAWATPSGPINLMKAEDMPPSHHSEGWYKKYCESHNHANPEQSYQADLQAAKESAVPITDQVMAIKKILYSLGISTESASIEDLKRWHIRADTIYGPFSLRHEIQEQCNAACLRFGSCTDPKKCCIKKVAILYDDTPEKDDDTLFAEAAKAHIRNAPGKTYRVTPEKEESQEDMLLEIFEDYKLLNISRDKEQFRAFIAMELSKFKITRKQ